MAVEKVTTMVLKVDLQCPSCYKKVKRVLCKFPQIRDQVYNEKQNTVTITVICCSPERIRDKLCCKGGKTIKSIEIKEPSKPKEAEKPKEKPKAEGAEKPKAAEAEKPKSDGKSKEEVKAEKPKSDGKADKPPAEKPADKPPKEAAQPAPEAAAKAAEMAYQPPMSVFGYPPGYPVGAYYEPCYEGYVGGPSSHHQGYGMPVPFSYDNNSHGYGYGHDHHHHHHHGYGYVANGGYYPPNRADYFSEENASGCAIM